ncbi:MAG: glycosyltransferase family 2 protein [Candidatus Bathyarchaeia archaeon]
MVDSVLGDEGSLVEGEAEGEKSVYESLEVGSVEVSVVIPSLNEAESIGECIERVKEAFVKCGVEGEVVVADNSDDETPEIARSLGARVVTPDRRGYGYAYHYGIKHARGKYIVIGDADGTYDFLEMPKLLEPLMNGEADIVVGSRFKGEIKRDAMPWLHRHVGNPVLTRFLNFFFKAGVSDAHSGFRALRREVLERLNLKACGMEYASEMIMKAAVEGLKIKEVPITYYPRRAGKSKLSSFQDGWRHLRFMLLHAPTYLYIFPGLAFTVLGLLLMAFTFFEVYLGYTPGLHSMILGSFGVVVGAQLVFLGLFAKIYGIKTRICHGDRFTNAVLKRLTLERGALTGLTLFLVGFAYSLHLVSIWFFTGFKTLPLKGQDMIAFTLMTIGLQIFFNSFYLSMMSSALNEG